MVKEAVRITITNVQSRGKHVHLHSLRYSYDIKVSQGPLRYFENLHIRQGYLKVCH